MSSSNYADLSQDSDSVTFASIENDISAEDPFQRNNPGNEMEPLNAGASVNSASSVGGDSSMSMSLLERIQQQKKQQQQPPGDDGFAGVSSAGQTGVGAGGMENNNYNNINNNDSSFGYPMAEETIYSHSAAPGPQTTNASINIPNYSSPSMGPNPYDESTSSSGFDYKDQMMNAISVMGRVAGSAAKGAYRGTKYMYHKISNRGSDGGADGLSAQRRNEMDYQRESLLMDPHDLEGSMSMGIGSAGTSSSATAAPNGLMAGIDGSGSAVAAQDGYSILGYLKQFCVDVKDIFLAAPRKVQILVIILAVFIIWLFISEEL